MPSSMPSDFGGLVNLISSAWQSGQWSLLAAAIMSVLVWALRSTWVLKELPAKAIPWVGAGTSIVAAMATNLGTSGLPWGQALLMGLGTGVQVSGLWELVLQHVLPAPAPKA